MASGRNDLGRRTSARVWVGVAVLLLASGATLLHAGGRCISVEVSSPIVLPDKSVHEEGSLRLCLARAISPVSSIHETYVNGMPISMLLSRDGKSEGPGEPQPYVLFRKVSGERLELIGYAWPAGERMKTFVLSQSARDVASLNTAIASENAAREEIVLLAARAE